MIACVPYTQEEERIFRFVTLAAGETNVAKAAGGAPTTSGATFLSISVCLDRTCFVLVAAQSIAEC